MQDGAIVAHDVAVEHERHARAPAVSAAAYQTDHLGVGGQDLRAAKGRPGVSAKAHGHARTREDRPVGVRGDVAAVARMEERRFGEGGERAPHAVDGGAVKPFGTKRRRYDVALGRGGDVVARRGVERHEHGAHVLVREVGADVEQEFVREVIETKAPLPEARVPLEALPAPAVHL